MPCREKNWFVYLLRCADSSLYCGVTVDITSRVAAHNGLGSGPLGGGAKYTATRRPVVLVYAALCKSQTEAMRLEQKIKKLTKPKKEALVSGTCTLENLFGE